MSREERQANAFTGDGFNYKGTHFRPLTGMMLLALQKAKSPYFGENTEEDGARILLDFLLVTSLTAAEAHKLSKDPDSWELAVFELADKFTQQDLENLGGLIAEMQAEVNESLVEARGENGASKKSRTSRTGSRPT
jgi:hypothetical protein